MQKQLLELLQMENKSKCIGYINIHFKKWEMGRR